MIEYITNLIQENVGETIGVLFLLYLFVIQPIWYRLTTTPEQRKKNSDAFAYMMWYTSMPYHKRMEHQEKLRKEREKKKILSNFSDN